MPQIDINCDLGESFGIWQLGNDAALLPLISSANIACGFHAGDPATMRKTVQLALDNQVAIGAHPGTPDLVGFGRRNMAITPQEAYDMVVYQVGALNGFITALGGTLHHVKPHGSLYNMAAVNPALATAIAQAVIDCTHPEIILYGLANSESLRQAQRLGLKTASEVFADRTYQADGTLTPRQQPGAMIQDETTAINQVLKMVLKQNVTTTDGLEIPIIAETVCIHGDGANALAFAQKINAALSDQQIKIKTM